jgi:hypothetical protein
MSAFLIAILVLAIVSFAFAAIWAWGAPECKCPPPFYPASDGRCGVCAGIMPQTFDRDGD